MQLAVDGPRLVKAVLTPIRDRLEVVCSADSNPPPTFTWFKIADESTIIANGTLLFDVCSYGITAISEMDNLRCNATNRYNGLNEISAISYRNGDQELEEALNKCG